MTLNGWDYRQSQLRRFQICSYGAPSWWYPGRANYHEFSRREDKLPREYS